MLGHLCHDKLVVAVAGTHGKTTTTTLAAWLNHKASGEGSAFLGGISRNFGSNLVLGGGRRLAVEADEYDRSFLRLSPDIAVVTAADADHLDIYGTLEAVHEAFAQFIAQIRPGGALIIKQGVELRFDNPSIGIYRYSLDCGGDFYACNIRPAEEGHCLYDIVTPDGIIADCRLGIPGMVNIENSIAAVAALWCADRRESKPFDHDAVREALATFEGVKRRFELYINTPRQVYVDDYAHHPEELRAAITSLKAMFPDAGSRPSSSRICLPARAIFCRRLRRGAVARRPGRTAADIPRPRAAHRGRRVGDHRRQAHCAVAHLHARAAGRDARSDDNRRCGDIRRGQHRRLLRRGSPHSQTKVLRNETRPIGQTGAIRGLCGTVAADRHRHDGGRQRCGESSRAHLGRSHNGRHRLARGCAADRADSARMGRDGGVQPRGQESRQHRSGHARRAHIVAQGRSARRGKPSTATARSISTSASVVR